MSENEHRTETVDLNAIGDGDSIVLDDGSVMTVGDYITWEPDGAHIEGVVYGQVTTIVIPTGQHVRRIVPDADLP